MKAVCVAGYKNSGKTTLCLALARELKARGRSVAVAKFSGCGFDEREGSDTALYKEVADTVLGLSENESFVSWTEKKTLQNLVPLAGTDVLLVEGGRDLGVLPRILVTRKALDNEGLAGLGPDLALAAYGADIPGVERIDDISTLADHVEQRGFLLPGQDCGKCGEENCRKLATEIVARTARPEDCTTAQTPISVDMNGHPLSLNPFAARMLASAITGMLGELKGTAPGEAIIRMNVKKYD